MFPYQVLERRPAQETLIRKCMPSGLFLRTEVLEKRVASLIIAQETAIFVLAVMSTW